MSLYLLTVLAPCAYPFTPEEELAEEPRISALGRHPRDLEGLRKQIAQHAKRCGHPKCNRLAIIGESVVGRERGLRYEYNAVTHLSEEEFGAPLILPADRVALRVLSPEDRDATWLLSRRQHAQPAWWADAEAAGLTEEERLPRAVVRAQRYPGGLPAYLEALRRETGMIGAEVCSAAHVSRVSYIKYRRHGGGTDYGAMARVVVTLEQERARRAQA